MTKIKKIIMNIIRDPRNRYIYLARSLGWMKFLPDDVYLKYFYWVNTREVLNIKNPKGFNEKIQWIKIFDRNPKYTMMTDKYLVRQYVESIVGGYTLSLY